MKEKGERTTSVFAKPRCGHTTRRGDAVVRPAACRVPRARRRERRRAVDVVGRRLPRRAQPREPSRLGVKSKAGTTPIYTMPSVSSRSVSHRTRARASRTQARTSASSPASATTTGATAAVDAATRLSRAPRARRRGRARVGMRESSASPANATFAPRRADGGSSAALAARLRDSEASSLLMRATQGGPRAICRRRARRRVARDAPPSLCRSTGWRSR